MPWMLKTKAVQVKTTSVMCPDGQSECPEGNTCCKLASGEYGCCPQPKAVCCSDHVHCCPTGYKCDVSAGTCSQGDHFLPLSVKTTALKVSTRKIAVTSVQCPDGQSQCPSGNTCCKMASGQYGCCPQPKAVCCSDHVHCCPSGYTCDVSAGTCSKGNQILPFLTKTPALKNTAAVTISKKCPGGDLQCPGFSTCCKLSSGNYGCCPLKEAVCCQDGAHCCPKGYTCHPYSSTCQKGRLTLPWYTKIQAELVSPWAVKILNWTHYKTPSDFCTFEFLDTTEQFVLIS